MGDWQPDKIGQLLLGVAAVVGALDIRRRGNKHGKILDEVNNAVNNKAPGEPTLRSVALETRQAAVDSAQALGRVEGHLLAHIETPMSQAHGSDAV